jgi:hypothetical protein
MSLTRQSYIGSFLGTDHRFLISFPIQAAFMKRYEEVKRRQ